MKARDRVVLSWPDPGQVEGAFCTSMIELVRARGSRIEGVLRVEGGGEDRLERVGEVALGVVAGAEIGHQTIQPRYGRWREGGNLGEMRLGG